MRKRLLLYTALMICTISLGLLIFKIVHSPSYFPENTLEKSFQNSKAKAVSSEIYFWAKVDKDAKNTCETLSQDIVKEFNILNDKTFLEKAQENDNIYKVDISGVTDDKKAAVISYQINKGKKSESENYIYLKFTKDLSSSGLVEIRAKVQKIFGEFGINPKVNSCITGAYEGRLGYEDINDICINTFRAVDARKVEGMRDDNTISVSAYSPQIDHYIRVNDKKINLNLAVRYNSLENKTYIWLATPVITTEY